MKFTEFNFCQDLTNNLNEINFIDSTPIQEKSIPLIMEGKDIAGLAQTGTGKTAAYLLPVINSVFLSKKGETTPCESLNAWKSNNFILTIVPTRELADQVSKEFNIFAKGMGLKGVAVYGGSPVEQQKKAIAEGVDFVFATPGRLIDLYKSHIIDFNQVRGVIFDEADRMFDMGFTDDVRFILGRIPRSRLFLLFSATLNFDVLNIAYEFESSPIEVNISKDSLETENVITKLFHIGEQEKPQYLLTLLKKHPADNVIIFTNYKNRIEDIVNFLKSNNIPALGISSLLNQSRRQKVMEKIKDENSSHVLVATDVAARGIDIKGLDLVINYDLPSHAEVFVHRVGRTGRADNHGLALNLASENDVEALSRIEDYLGKKIDMEWLEQDELIKEFQSFKKSQYSNRNKVKSKSSEYRQGKSNSDRNKKPYDKKSSTKKYSKKTTSEQNSPRSEQEGSRSKVRPKNNDQRKKIVAKKLDYSKSFRKNGPSNSVGQKLNKFIKTLFS